MSDIMTVCRSPGVPGGSYMDYGRHSRSEIIRLTKELAAYEIEKWTNVLATPDNEFDVRVVRGIQRQELVERLSHSPQEGETP